MKRQKYKIMYIHYTMGNPGYTIVDSSELEAEIDALEAMQCDVIEYYPIW